MMSRWTGRPAYEQIAASYRAKILDGELPPGTKLPSESDLMREYDVSRIVAKMAIRTLRTEGLIYSHPGKGSFVKEQTRLVRDAKSRYMRKKSPPFKGDATNAKKDGTWRYTSQPARASEAIANRLGIAPGDPVMQTSYRYFADERPIQISTSWEPLAVTGGTPVELPEESPVTGVIARMDSIGKRIDHVIERITARAARPEEIESLALPHEGAYVLSIPALEPRRTFPLHVPTELQQQIYDFAVL
jgi:DNA-binding GntR family transcriptional regulator